MAFLRGLFVQRDGSNNGTTPRGARHALGGLIGRSSAGGVQTGVLIDSMAPVVSGTGAMTYSIRAFAAVTQSSVANGPVISANDATLTVATTAAPGSNSRIDSVYAIQRLITADGGSGASNEFEVLVAQGTVSSSPTPPSIPAGALRLANVTVTSGATATSGLTFERAHSWVSANGGLVPMAKGANQFEVWNGTDLVRVNGSPANMTPPALMQYGVTNLTGFQSSGFVNLNLPVAFPTGIVAASVQSANPSDDPWIFNPLIGNANTTAQVLRLRVRRSTDAVPVSAGTVSQVHYIVYGN